MDYPPLTKRDQFRLKARKKDGPRPGRKSTKKKRGSDASKCAVASPPKRRRRLLRKSSRVAEKEHEDEDEEAGEGPAPKAKAKCSPKAKAKCSAKAKAKAKCSAKAKAKCSAKAKACSAKAKAKCSPKAKAKCSPKAKATAKSAAKVKRDPPAGKKTCRGRRAPPCEGDAVFSLDEGLWWYLYVDGQDEVKKIIADFTQEAEFKDGTLCTAFKADLKARVDDSAMFGMTMYWTRPAVGLLHRTTGIEIGQVSIGKVEATWAAKMAALGKAASLLATYIEGLIKDGYVEDTATAMTKSYDIFAMKEFLKKAVVSAIV